MPIYAYRCATCGHAQDVLQKLSDPVLTVCPACSNATYVKQVTAAGFQLKGSGWYVTDFRGDKKKPEGAPAEAGNGEVKKAEVGTASDSSAGGETKKADSAAPAPAPAPAAAASPAPAAAPAPAPVPAGKTGS